MDVGPAGAWDDHPVYFGDVLVIDSIFHMWYSGHTGQDDYRKLSDRSCHFSGRDRLDKRSE